MPAARVVTKCAHCHKSLRVDVEKVGTSVRCPACGTSFVITTIDLSRPSESAASLETPARPAETRHDGDEAQATMDGAAGQRVQVAGPQKTIGRFLIEQTLGRGGFGVVYQATDPLLHRQVALKVPLFSAGDRKKTQRFLNEAKAAARLRHPTIVAVFESGETEGNLYLAAEFVKGETLAARAKKSRPAIEQSVRWVRELARALAYAHEQGIVHRDIKPQNIMIDAQERPQIMDFGLAKRLDQDSTMTADGSVLGTPAYMSPEQARGEHSAVGPQSDQYSLGVVLYELLTGQKPFEGAPAVVLTRVISEEPPRPTQIRPAIAADLEAICLKAMDKSPARRYADLTAFEQDLARWEQGEPTVARPLTMVQRAGRWARRAPVAAGLTAAVALLLVLAAAGSVAATWMLDRSNGELQSALASAREQTQEAEAQTEKARLASRQAEIESELAGKEIARATAASETSARALAELKVANSSLNTKESKLQSVTMGRQKAADTIAAADELRQTAGSRSKSLEQTAITGRRQEYLRQIRTARTLLDSGDYSAAGTTLQSCAEEQRGWEWRMYEDCVRRKSAQFHRRVVTVDSRSVQALSKGDSGQPVAISPNGKILATTRVISEGKGAARSSRLFLWNTEGELLQLNSVFQFPAGWPEEAIRFSRDGEWVCLFDSKQGRIWRCPAIANRNLTDVTTLKTWWEPPDSVRRKLISKQSAARGAAKEHFDDAQTAFAEFNKAFAGQSICTMPSFEPPHARRNNAVPSPDGSRLARQNYGRPVEITVSMVAGNEAVASIPVDLEDWFLNVAWSADGTQLICLGTKELVPCVIIFSTDDKEAK